jgi:hypothetical protein
MQRGASQRNAKRKQHCQEVPMMHFLSSTLIESDSQGVNIRLSELGETAR